MSEGYRPNWFPTGSCETENMASIFEICESLHGSLTGASDPLEPDAEKLYLRSLKWILENWKKSRQTSENYDNAVKNLIHQTLAERGLVASIKDGVVYLY